MYAGFPHKLAQDFTLIYGISFVRLMLSLIASQNVHFPLNQYTNPSRSNRLLNNAIQSLSLPEINFGPLF
jgi:hypothetical protein